MMIAIVQPPYFKLLGSHNDKLAPSLLFLASKLAVNAKEVIVVNADAGSSSHYIPWRQLYDNFEYFEKAVTNGSPAIYEAFEKIMQYHPNVAILEAGDFLEATVDIGSPFIAMHLAKLLIEQGVRVYGFGPLWYEDSFNIEMYEDNILNLPPLNLSLIPKDSKYDTVFTKLGCPYKCIFCLQQKYANKWEKVPVNIIRSQLWLERHYIEDPVFDPDVEVINVLSGRRYICEARVDRVNEDWVKRAKSCGVEIAKLGVESGSDTFIKKTKKGISQNWAGTARTAVNLLKKAGIKVIVYIMLGWYEMGEKEYWESLDFFRELEADYYVVNVTCPYGRRGRDWRFDTHFSPRTARYWGLPDKLVYAYYDLQGYQKNPSLI